MKSLARSFMSSVAVSRSSLVQALGSKTNQYATMDAGGQNLQQMQQANQAAEMLIRQMGVKMIQQIYSQTVNPANTPVLYVQPRPVGLVLGFIVEVNATLAQPDAAYALTSFGPANALSQIRFDDLSNVTRIQTTGWHLHCINSAKGQVPYAAVRTNTSYPVAFGNTFGGNLASNQAQNVIQAASTYDATHYAQGVQMMYWVPMAYSSQDYRGAYYANVVNANAQLQLTINPSNQAFVAATANPVNAVYQSTAGTTGAWGTSFTVNVYQVWMDQLPVANGAPVLPQWSLAVIYDIKNSSNPGVTANQDFPVSYSNWREFLSTTAIYSNPNSGVMPTAGSDINYWALQQANSTNILKYTPKYNGLFARSIIGDDFPTGVYYFDSRNKPISTVQFGNQQLILNASTVNSGAQVLVGFEAFSYQNTIVGAASLSSGT